MMMVKGSLPVLCILFVTWSLSFAQAQTPPFHTYLANAATDQQKLEVYRSIFNHYKSVNNDSVRYYLEEGLQVFTEHNFIKGRGALLGMLSGNYSEQGKPEEAQKAADEALKIFTSLNDEISTARIHNSLGVLAGKKGQYDEAVKHFLQALSYFDRVSDTSNIVNTYIKLGMANDMSGNKNEALSYYQKGLNLSLRIKQSANTAYLYNNIGTLYARDHLFDKALPYFQKALNISNNPQFAQARIQPLDNIGNIYMEKNEPAKALEYYQQALKVAQTTGMTEQANKLQHSIDMAESSISHGQATSLQASLDNAVQTGNKETQVDILTHMAQFADTNHNYKDEVAYLKRVQALKDSLYNTTRAKEIASLQSAYELKRTNTQLAALRVAEQRNLQKNNLLIVIATILAATLVLLLFFLGRSIKLNRKLSVREQELEKTNVIKDRLFSIIGHDLRGPVGNIPALLEIYKGNDTTEAEKTFILDSLEENSVASLETLEKLLNWGKLQIKGNVLNKTVFNAGYTADNSLRLFRVATNNKNIHIINRVPEKTEIYADENQFKFIIRNLLSNAVKYTNVNGCIEINATLHTNTDFIVFSVKDNGIGISPEKQQHIFELYHESTPGTAAEAGNSIGLMLCKEFTEQNGGRIWVESEKGNGATFYFTVMAATSRQPIAKAGNVAPLQYHESGL